MKNPHAQQSAGASNGLPGHSEASTPKPAKFQRSIADEIRALRPWEKNSTTTLRSKTNTVAVRAAARATTAHSPHARQLFWLVNEIAVTWLWAPGSDEQLKDMLAAMTCAATSADTFERYGSGR
jgi:hypothetical protein